MDGTTEQDVEKGGVIRKAHVQPGGVRKAASSGPRPVRWSDGEIRTVAQVRKDAEGDPEPVMKDAEDTGGSLHPNMTKVDRPTGRGDGPTPRREAALQAARVAEEYVDSLEQPRFRDLRSILKGESPLALTKAEADACIPGHPTTEADVKKFDPDGQTVPQDAIDALRSQAQSNPPGPAHLADGSGAAAEGRSDERRRDAIDRLLNREDGGADLPGPAAVLQGVDAGDMEEVANMVAASIGVAPDVARALAGSVTVQAAFEKADDAPLDGEERRAIVELLADILDVEVADLADALQQFSDEFEAFADGEDGALDAETVEAMLAVVPDAEDAEGGAFHGYAFSTGGAA